MLPAWTRNPDRRRRRPLPGMGCRGRCDPGRLRDRHLRVPRRADPGPDGPLHAAAQGLNGRLRRPRSPWNRAGPRCSIGLSPRSPGARQPAARALVPVPAASYRAGRQPSPTAAALAASWLVAGGIAVTVLGSTYAAASSGRPRPHATSAARTVAVRRRRAITHADQRPPPTPTGTPSPTPTGTPSPTPTGTPSPTPTRTPSPTPTGTPSPTPTVTPSPTPTGTPSPTPTGTPSLRPPAPLRPPPPPRPPPHPPARRHPHPPARPRPAIGADRARPAGRPGRHRRLKPECRGSLRRSVTWRRCPAGRCPRLLAKPSATSPPCSRPSRRPQPSLTLAGPGP